MHEQLRSGRGGKTFPGKTWPPCKVIHKWSYQAIQPGQRISTVLFQPDSTQLMCFPGTTLSDIRTFIYLMLNMAI